MVLFSVSMQLSRVAWNPAAEGHTDLICRSLFCSCCSSSRVGSSRYSEPYVSFTFSLLLRVACRYSTVNLTKANLGNINYKMDCYILYLNNTCFILKQVICFVYLGEELLTLQQLCFGDWGRLVLGWNKEGMEKNSLKSCNTSDSMSWSLCNTVRYAHERRIKNLVFPLFLILSIWKKFENCAFFYFFRERDK